MLFDKQEYAARKEKALAAMKERNLDALLMFAQESMYWLTGYDTFGYCFFQCLILTPDGRTTLLTRSADLRQAQRTSNIDDIHVWIDGANVNPTVNLRDLMGEMDLLGSRLGVEFDTHGLTAHLYRLLDERLNNFAEMQDASSLIQTLRLRKSKAEQAFVREAARQGDLALDAAMEVAAPGISEGHVLAAMQGAIFQAGGDYPGNEFIIGAGDDALLCRYKAGRNIIEAKDQLTLEWSGAAAHYHAPLMRTLVIGKPRDNHQALFDAAKDALLAVEKTLQVGKTFGDVFEAHARALDAAGLSNHRLNACGYNVGARFSPSWMDGPMFFRENTQEIQAHMSLFAHMIIMDSNSGAAMTLGQTYLTHDNGPENLSRHKLEMIVL